LSPDDQWLTARSGISGIQRWNATTGEPDWLAVCLTEDESVTVSAAGQILFGDPQTLERELVYLVERDNGRIESLKYSEFQKLVSPKTPVAAMSPDRRAAEWVLSIGGSVTVLVDANQLTVADPDDLPTEAFAIYGINPGANELVSDADLVQLRGLKSLGGLYLDSTQITDAGLAHLKGLSLKHITLQSTKVTDVGVKSLSHNSELYRLMLLVCPH
jgi:hypothetical protein